MTKVLLIIVTFSLSIFSLLGFYSVTTEKVIVKENSSQENILNIKDNFSDPSITFNEIYGDDWDGR